MDMITNILNILSENRNIFDAHGVNLIGVFGSRIRGSSHKGSDLDILISKKEDFSTSLFELMDLEDELTALLNLKVDLALKDSLKPRIRENILNEVLYL